MRTFIALELEETLKKALTHLIDKLRLKGGKIKWVKEEGMHLTLKFLGEIDQKKASEVEKILDKVARNSSSFPLSIKGTGYFPPSRNPRVLWAGVEAGEVLESLHHELEVELEKIGFAREEREFRPHLTLGRVKSSDFLKDTLNELEKHRNTTFGHMNVNKITFFRSVLKPSGAEYSVLSEFFLK
ncbi:MAG: RNA 2',3'-cyclic phosphodiesterase [Candidatus Aminicenantales bacterium]